jgi:hypothetical protein
MISLPDLAGAVSLSEDTWFSGSENALSTVASLIVDRPEQMADTECPPHRGQFTQEGVTDG